MDGIQSRSVGENLNIWRLSFKKILRSFKDLRLDVREPITSCRTFAERIVTRYNENRDYGRYERAFKEGALPSWDNKGGFGRVELDLYFANYPHDFRYGDELAKLGADRDAFTSSYKHYLFFLYGTVTKVKRVALFAFTTGQAYNVFKSFADFKFPNKIARALLVSKEVKDTHDRWTVGPVLASHSWYKEGETYEDNPDALEKIYIAFRAVINPSAEVIQMVSVIEKGTEVKVTRGSICFHKRIIPVDEFPTLIAHLTCVVEGEGTGLNDGALPPPDNFSWLDYLVPVEDVGDIVACRQEAQNLICAALQNPNESRSFTFCPKFFFDYRLSPEITCRIKKNGVITTLGTWPYPPTTQEIIDVILSYAEVKEEDIPLIELSYHRNCSIEYENLVSCFDGELLLQGQRIFRAYGLWYKPNADYLEQVQRSINRLVRDHLIPIGDSDVHPSLPWQKGSPVTDEDTQPYHMKVGDLAKQEGQYIDQDGTILCRRLFALFFGRSATFKQFHQSIQELFNDVNRKKLSGDDLIELGIKGEKAHELFSQMQKKKKVLDSKNRVVIPRYEGIPEGLESLLGDRTDHHEEGHFNASFHGKEGFLVGDTATPVGIELFDLLRIVDKNLYLFHVKEGLDGDHVRAVCSQIRNGARKLKAALSGHSNFLDEFCDYVYNVEQPICYRLRKEYPEKAAFRQMFRERFDRPRERIIFVCAFLDTHSPQRFLQEGPECIEGSDKKEVISSTVAKLELIAVEQAVRGCGFGFKLCQIERSGNGVFSPSVVPPLLVPFQELREFDLSDYQYNTDLVVRKETVGDGNCSFHSVLGVPIGGSYKYDNGNMRQEFLGGLTNAHNHWTHAALGEKYQSNIRGLLGKLVRNELDASDRLFFEGVTIDGQSTLDFIRTKSQDIFTRDETPNKLLKLLDPEYKGRFKTLKEFSDWLKEGTNGANYLMNLGIPKLRKIGDELGSNGTNKKRQENIFTLANELEATCYTRWRQAILMQEYYLSDDELAMIGYVYTRSIVLIQKGIDHTITAREICDVNPGQRVFVYGDGNHYERCISP